MEATAILTPQADVSWLSWASHLLPNFPIHPSKEELHAIRKAEKLVLLKSGEMSYSDYKRNSEDNEDIVTSMIQPSQPPTAPVVEPSTSSSMPKPRLVKKSKVVEVNSKVETTPCAKRKGKGKVQAVDEETEADVISYMMLPGSTDGKRNPLNVLIGSVLVSTSGCLISFIG